MNRYKLWEQYLSRVERAIRFIPDKDDVRQEAQLGVWTAIQTYSPTKGKLDIWIIVGMWNAIRNYRKNERRFIHEEEKE